MTTKALTGYRLDAKGKLIKKAPRMAAHERKRIEGKAKSLEKRWRAKSK